MEFIEFDPASRFHVSAQIQLLRCPGGNRNNPLVRLLYQSGPILDCPGQVSDVDEVEGTFWPGPFAFGVIDLERHVRGDPGNISVCPHQ